MAKGRCSRPSGRQTGTSDIGRDKERKAMQPGGRVSHNKKRYTENRQNRSDMKGKRI